MQDAPEIEDEPLIFGRELAQPRGIRRAYQGGGVRRHRPFLPRRGKKTKGFSASRDGAKHPRPLGDSSSFPLSSSRRKPGSIWPHRAALGWIPAFAGMTEARAVLFSRERDQLRLAAAADCGGDRGEAVAAQQGGEAALDPLDQAGALVDERGIELHEARPGPD